MEEQEAIVKNWSAALRAALPATVPVMTGYLCLGAAFGILLRTAGYGIGWSITMSMICYCGSMQFVGVSLLSADFYPFLALRMSVMVNARHDLTAGRFTGREEKNVQMTSIQALITILAIAVGTQFTRWLPFWLFPEKKDPPAVVLYLGKVLPPAMMGLLTVYCFKNVAWLSGTHGAPELLASAAVVGLHLWKRNVLFSIAGGTALYMVLVQAVFA